MSISLSLFVNDFIERCNSPGLRSSGRWNENAGEEQSTPSPNGLRRSGVRPRYMSPRLKNDGAAAGRRAESLRAQEKFNEQLVVLHELLAKRPRVKQMIQEACNELRGVEDRLDRISLRMSGGSSFDIGGRSDDDSDTEEFRDREETLMREMMQSERSDLFVRKQTLERDAKRATRMLNTQLEELDSDIDQQLDVLVGIIEADLDSYDGKPGMVPAYVPAECLFARVAFAFMRAKYQTDAYQVNLTSDPGCGYDVSVENGGDGALERVGLFGRALHFADDWTAGSVVRELVGTCAMAGVKFATLFVRTFDEEVVGYDLDRAANIGVEVEIIALRRFKELIRLYLSDAKLSDFL